MVQEHSVRGRVNFDRRFYRRPERAREGSGPEVHGQIPRAYARNDGLERMSMKSWILFLFLLTSTTFAAEPPKPTPAAKSAKSFDALMQLGQDCLYAGDYKAARDAFFDANVLRAGPKPLHGLGLS